MLSHVCLGDMSVAEMEADMLFTMRHDPFGHQQRLFEDTRLREFFAIFWEQGTGKTKGALDCTSGLFLEGHIDGLLVLAPDGVHTNWVEVEIPEHLPVELKDKTLTFAYQTSKSKTKRHKEALEATLNWRGLAVMTMSYDAFMTDSGKMAAWRFLKGRRTLYILDESSRIKTPAAKRTKSVVKSGVHAAQRRILDGTPISQGPFDIYAPMKFLDANFWRPHDLDSYAAFKHHFGVWKRMRTGMGREFDVLVEYQRLDELQRILAPHSSRVLKEDVLDLPPKLYSKRYFEMTPQQQKMYDQLRDEFFTVLEQEGPCPRCDGTGTLHYEGFDFQCDACEGSGKAQGVMVSGQMAIVRMLRLQQVLCGYVPDEQGTPFHDIPGGNPRLATTLGICEDLPHKALIWTRFRRDNELIHAGLSRMGATALRCDGSVSDEDISKAKDAFQNGDELQFLVCGIDKMYAGHTLHRAKTCVAHNNTFKLLHRLQWEDRAHRAGMDNDPVHYIDVMCPGTIDEHTVDALRAKYDIAAKVNGDKLKEWLR